MNELRGFVHEITPKFENKLIKLVGEKCLVNVDIENVNCEVLWDTGAQVSLISRDWLSKWMPYKQPRPVHELFSNSLIVKSASGDDLPFEGYVELCLKAGGHEQINVPF